MPLCKRGNRQSRDQGDVRAHALYTATSLDVRNDWRTLAASDVVRLTDTHKNRHEPSTDVYCIVRACRVPSRLFVPRAQLLVNSGTLSNTGFVRQTRVLQASIARPFLASFQGKVLSATLSPSRLSNIVMRGFWGCFFLVVLAFKTLVLEDVK